MVLSTTTNETKAKGRVRKVVLEITPDGPNPFEGLGGERLHIVVVRLNDDETTEPIQESAAAPSPSPPEPAADEDAGTGCAPPQEPASSQSFERPVRKFHELPASTQVTLKCQESAFREYLSQYLSDVRTKDDAIVFVRQFCGVASRK